MLNKLKLQIKQFGLCHAFFQIPHVALRWAYQVEHYIVFIIPEFSPPAFTDSCIIPFTHERIRLAARTGELEESAAQMMFGFLSDACLGICAEIDGKLAGYAWVQYKGEYRFGYSGRMIIPPGYAVVKNLFVFPNYRGEKLGQKLNEGRLAKISSGCIPVGFIIPQNRYAIRNWEKLGFQPVLQVKRRRWFRYSWQMQIERLNNCLQACELEKALATGST